MDKLKNKYEIILGFVTLIISLSAFKDELSKIEIYLGYGTITLADYFLYSVYGFSVSLYLYIMENVLRDTKVGEWKIWNAVLKVAYFIFIFILLSPLALLVNIIFYKLYLLSAKVTYTKSYILEIVIGIVTGLMAQRLSNKLEKELKRKKKIEIEEQEIKELDNAVKLFVDGFYSHSVLESFKVLQTHLYKQIQAKGYRIPQFKFKELLQVALNEGIVLENELAAINDIRSMRNVAAHSDIQYTKQQAEFALEYVKILLQRNPSKIDND